MKAREVTLYVKTGLYNYRSTGNAADQPYCSLSVHRRSLSKTGTIHYLQNRKIIPNFQKIF